MKYLKTFNEARKEMNSLNTDVGLFIFEDSLTLYNPKIDKVIAYIGLSQDSDGTYYFPSVAAEKGYGPMIYELAMMFVGENGLMVSRDGDIRGEALDVWIKFYNSDRKDIIKTTLELTDEDFNFAIIHGEDNTHENEHDKLAEFEAHVEESYEETILAYNTIMYMYKTETYNRLISIANDWLNKGVSLEEVIDKGHDFFSYRYGE